MKNWNYTDFSPYSRVAKCCIATGDINSARQALDAALAIEPNNGAVGQEMNSLKLLVKHHDDAQNSFNNGDHRKVNSSYPFSVGLISSAQSRAPNCQKQECQKFRYFPLYRISSKWPVRERGPLGQVRLGLIYCCYCIVQSTSENGTFLTE